MYSEIHTLWETGSREVHTPLYYHCFTQFLNEYIAIEKHTQILITYRGAMQKFSHMLKHVCNPYRLYQS